MIAEGTYTARAVQWDWGLTRDGKEQVVVQFEIVEGPYQGWCQTWYGSFSEKAQARTIESLRYAGWKNDDIMTMEGMGDILCQIVIAHEVQQEGKNAGNTIARVRWVNRLGGGGPIKLDRPMDMAQKRMFAQKLKLHARQVPAIQGGYPAKKEAPSEEKHDKDVPF
jgi:hypothetical protein